MLKIEYKASVKTPDGWRSVYMQGLAEKISDERVRVLEITHIDDKIIDYNMSRTGSNRQKYNRIYFANNEEDKIKNISSLYSISE